MILIYTSKITNRIKYIFKIYFKELIGTEYSFTTQKEEFTAYEGIKLSYTDQALDNEIFFCSANLLFENNIHEIEHKFVDFENNTAICPVFAKKAAFPFDPFAAAFYMITRYEEYLPYLKDQYERFSAEQSIAYKKYFLRKPMINIWAAAISEIICKRYPDFKPKTNKFKFVPTIDIDCAYAFKLKGIIRSIGGYIKSVKDFNFKEIAERSAVLAGIRKDHFDTFDYQFKIHEKYKLNPIYFILFADYNDYDKNIHVNNQKFRSLIKMLEDNAEVGIHPSYASNSDIKILKKEINTLSKVLNRQISKSRQHFLKLSLPQTYRNLIDLDITDDYTMGYASDIGFRASICSSFNFYDLEMEVETNLRIHPFAFMEGTLRDYLSINADRAMDYIKPLIDEVKAVNGTFISLWHNESLSNQRRWVGWQQIYEDMIKYATEK